MRKKLIIPFFSILTLVSVSCSDNKDECREDQKIKERKSISLNAQEIEMSRSLNEFPVSLLISAYETESNESGYSGNVMVSPLSTQMVLGMTMNSLEEGDREEISRALNIRGSNISHFNTYSNTLLQNLGTLDPSISFSLNNGFWLSAKGVLNSEYEGLLKTSYSSDIDRFDEFDTGTVDAINQWTKANTGGAIDQILRKEDIDPSIMSVWLNTLYFKGSWTQKFNKEYTQRSQFYGNFPHKTPTGNVDMMRGEGFRYVHSFSVSGSDEMEDQIVSVMLPYGNESFVFIGVLPAESNPDIKSTLSCLRGDYWQEIDNILSYEKDTPSDISVLLPRISLEKEMDLIPTLKGVGVSKLFEGVNVSASLGLPELRVNIFRQKIKLDVDEEGSEIKVATVESGMLTAPRPTFVEFNRPFIYFVRERSTGAVLLAGVYDRPGI